MKLPALKEALEELGRQTETNAEGAQVATPAAQGAQTAKANLDGLFPETVMSVVFKHIWNLVPRFFYFC